jgi:hypothetical protein
MTVTELKWFQFRERMMDWRKKSQEDQPVRITQNEERSIIILQKRYGFTREQALFQLRRYYPNARLDG